jgi:aspartokinase
MAVTDVQAGASELSICCVVEEMDVERAICILHERFFPADAVRVA